MIERGIGYWITAEGQYISTPPRVSHADLMRQLIDADSLDESAREAFIRDANAYALSQGWTRVRIYPGEQIIYVDFGVDREAQHRKAVVELLDGLGLVGYRMKFTDEHGNYVGS